MCADTVTDPIFQGRIGHNAPLPLALPTARRDPVSWTQPVAHFPYATRHNNRRAVLWWWVGGRQTPIIRAGAGWPGLFAGDTNMKRDPIAPPHSDIIVQPISHDVLAEKYLKPGESGVDDLFQRVARALASVELEADRPK